MSKKPTATGTLTPGSKRRALRERNETYVSGSNMKKATIAPVTGNIFQGSEDVASSTLKADQIVSTGLINYDSYH